MKVSLKELIETGSFGPVKLGMNCEEVESSLGAPDDVGGTSRKYRKPSIWKYGEIELHFVQGADSLFLIHLDDFDVSSGGKSLHLDPWVIRGTLSLSDAEQHLSRSEMVGAEGGSRTLMPLRTMDFHALFFSSQFIGSQSSTLLLSGSMIHANFPFSCDSGPDTISTPFCFS